MPVFGVVGVFYGFGVVSVLGVPDSQAQGPPVGIARVAIIDEGQLRTLLELHADRSRQRPMRTEVRDRFQEAIVGTDALLANDMLAGVQFAGDQANRFWVGSRRIELPHEQYILINNGDYLTAVRSGPRNSPSSTVRAAASGTSFDWTIM